MSISKTVTEAVTQRRSVRDFGGDPVSSTLVREILETARCAPSGGNLQPWHVHIVGGHTYRKLIDATQTQFDINPSGEPLYHHPYPPDLTEIYRERRRTIGHQLYEIVGVKRGDRTAKLQYLRRNYEFFGAPVGMIFTIEQQMEPLQWVDLGMFIQTIMLLATEQGLATCCQGAWSLFTPIIRETLGIANHHIVACGMAMGYADDTALINRLESQRASLDEIATFHD